jgi:hypothetical protein
MAVSHLGIVQIQAHWTTVASITKTGGGGQTISIIENTTTGCIKILWESLFRQGGAEKRNLAPYFLLLTPELLEAAVSSLFQNDHDG